MIKPITRKYAKKQMIKALTIAVSASSFVGVFVALIPFGDRWGIAAIIILSVFLLAFILLLAWFLTRKKRRIVSHNNIVVTAMYGDLLSVKKKDDGDKPVVVIPVNSAFDYLVDDELNTENPIVSRKTLHGKWILHLTNNEKERLEELKSDIEKGIAASKLKVIGILSNKRGNQNVYELGSSVFIEREDCTYMLFALTDFDENNLVIERTVSTFSNLASRLVKEIGRCQGREVFMPVMGVGMSLFGLDHKRAFEIIRSAIISNLSTLKSSINIVVYDGDKDKLSIFDD